MTSEPVSSYAIPYSLDSIAPGIAIAVFGPSPRAGMNPRQIARHAAEQTSEPQLRQARREPRALTGLARDTE